LHFCDYLPLQEDLDLYFKFHFSLPKEDLYQSLIEIGLLVLEKIFLFKTSDIAVVKMCKIILKYILSVVDCLMLKLEMQQAGVTMIPSK
jgi:hypothetical protein